VSISTYPPPTAQATVQVTESLAFNSKNDGTNEAASPTSWFETTQSSMNMQWRTPEHYAGGDITLTIARRASAGSARMQCTVYRLPDNGALVEVLNVAVNYTFADTHTHYTTVTIPASVVVIGAFYLLQIIRLPADALDTLTGLVNTDGIAVTYNAHVTVPIVQGQHTVPIPIASGGTFATTAPQARTNLGLGTMSQQDASAVAITGGSATLSGDLTLSSGNVNLGGQISRDDRAGNNVQGIYSILNTAGGANRNFLLHTGNAPSYLGGTLQVAQSVGLGVPPRGDTPLFVFYPRATHYGVIIQPDTSGIGTPIVFLNSSGVVSGSITSGDTSTSFNTASDARLKHAIEKLVGALDIVRQLNPIHFRWNSTDEKDEGFLAHELMHVVPRAVTGEPDAVNDDGTIRPQQVDHSKLVPFLTAALQELAAQVQALTARVAQLEGA
jgi:hypothetical protein